MPPRPPLPDRLRPGVRTALDVLAGAGYGVLGHGVLGHRAVPAWAGIVASLLAAASVASCRRAPVLAAFAALAVFWVQPTNGSLAFLAVPPAGYALLRVAALRSARTASAVLAVVLTGPVATALPDFTHRGAVAPFCAILLAAFTAGLLSGGRRRYLDGLVRHHEHEADRQREQGRRGIVDERLRIARELHDVVAHSTSLITVQAAYGHLVADERPGEARAALAAIEETGRETLAELRRLLGVLRTDVQDADAWAGTRREPSPGLEDLPRLVGGTGRAGVQVDLSVTGPVRPLPTGVELAAYRIVQEALTNVVRHARTTSARVEVTYDTDELVLEITDAGRGGRLRPGLGLLGMQERANLYGGWLEAGPRPSGGFGVLARLPVARAAPGPLTAAVLA